MENQGIELASCGESNGGADFLADINARVERYREVAGYFHASTALIVIFASVSLFLAAYFGIFICWVLLAAFVAAFVGVAFLADHVLSPFKVSLLSVAPAGRENAVLAKIRAAYSSRWVRSDIRILPNVNSFGPFVGLARMTHLRCCGRHYFFGRDLVVLCEGCHAEALPVANVKCRVSSVTRETSGSLHGDEVVVSSRWLHQRVDGGPDRRYACNYKIHTYLLGRLVVTFPAGEGEALCSNVNALRAASPAVPSTPSVRRTIPMPSKRPSSQVVQESSGALIYELPPPPTDPFEDMLSNAVSYLTEYVRSQDDSGFVERILAERVSRDLDRWAEICRLTHVNLAYVVVCDMTFAMSALGHWSEAGFREGRELDAFVRVLSRLFEIGSDVSACAVSDFVGNLVGFELREKGPLAFSTMMLEGGYDSAASKYAHLMYRWASVVTKADGTVTKEESEYLASLIPVTRGVASERPIVKTEKEPVRAQVSESKPRKNQRSVMEEVSAMERLTGLIGLVPVKQELSNLANFVKIQKTREHKGLKTVPVSYHCVFTGNPGTGKTTVARILADVYRELGVVRKGHLVETDRSGLVAEYVGQTAVKTNKIIDSALDGILFVDEAYSLIAGSGEDYGREAIATLLKRMEDDRDRLVVVLAGYADEMKAFINSNPGLQSRFNRYVDFPDYATEELVEIFLSLAHKNEYVCTEETIAALRAKMSEATGAGARSFGNGRFVRNLFESTIERQAVRLAPVGKITQELLQTLEPEDLP